MECEPVIEALLRQVAEVGYRDGRNVGVEGNLYGAVALDFDGGMMDARRVGVIGIEVGGGVVLACGPLAG